MKTPKPHESPTKRTGAPSTAGRRWARQDSGALIGHGGQRPTSREVRPPGRELEARYRPGSFYLAQHSPGTNEENTKQSFGASAPTHVRKTGAARAARHEAAAAIA